MRRWRSPWSRIRRSQLVAAFPVLVLACGGGAPPPVAPNGAADDTEASATRAAGQGSSASAASYCADDGCFDCGDGLCMQGWYCDLGVRGGPACSFVPECEAQSGCTCVTSALGGGCRCEERDGGAYVTCD